MNPVTLVADPGRLGSGVEALNALLRAELAAVETYNLAVARFADHPFQADLRTIRYDHETAAGVLRDHIRNLEGEPATSSGPRSMSALLNTGQDRLMDLDTVLDAFRRDEEAGVASYERVLQADEMPQECRFAIKAELLPRCHEHIDALAAMASALARKG